MLKGNELKKFYHKYNDLSIPDPDFNPKRNKALIDETVREATKYHATQGMAVDEAMGERIEAVSAYGCYRFNGGEKQIRKYLGDKLYTKFIGEKILSKVRVAQTVNRLNGNKKFRNSILL